MTTSYANAVAAEIAQSLLSRVLNALDRHKIRCIPLKGALLHARWPMLRKNRSLADIDILVEPTNFAQALTALRQAGFSLTVRTRTGAVLVDDAWPLPIDLHQSLFPKGHFALHTEDVFNRAESNALWQSDFALQMSDNDLIAHLIGHLVKGRQVRDAFHGTDDIIWSMNHLRLPIVECADHLLALGLRRAAAYALHSPRCLADEKTNALLQALELNAMDRTIVSICEKLGPALWTPHALNTSLPMAALSGTLHAVDKVRRIARSAAL